MSLVNAPWTTLPYEGVLFVLSYGVLVRYWLRPRLAARWDYFNARKGAPYFMLFTVTSLWGAILFALDFTQAAANFAMASYFLLVNGVVVEIIDINRA